MTIRELVNHIKVSQGYSMSEMADMAGIKRTTLNSFYAGKSKFPNINLLERLCTTFNLERAVIDNTIHFFPLDESVNKNLDIGKQVAYDDAKLLVKLYGRLGKDFVRRFLDAVLELPEEQVQFLLSLIKKGD